MNKKNYIRYVLFFAVFGILLFFVSCKNSEIFDTSIVIQQKPEKLEYYDGERLDLTGIIVKYINEEGKAEELIDFVSEPGNGSILKGTESGKQTIKISYLDKETDFEISIIDSALSVVSQPENKIFEMYEENQKLSFTTSITGNGTIITSLYRKNPNDEDFIKIIEEEPEVIRMDGIKTFDVIIPQNNYTKADYYCTVQFKDENQIRTIKTDDVKIEQKLKNYIPMLKVYTSDGKSITSKTDYISASFDLTSDEYDDIFLEEIKIKGRGNTSWKQPKKPYTIKLDKKTKVLGMNKSKKWVLVANYSDKTLLRNYYVSQIGNDIFTGMKWNPAFRFVDLILNDEYMGTYILGEQVKIEENRVNIQNAADTFVGDGKDLNNDGVVDIKDGGFIVEVNKRLDENFNFTTTKGICISLKDPDTDDFEKGSVTLSEENENYIKNIIQTAEDILYSKDWLDSEKGYTKYIDIDSFIDWYFVNEFTKNNDAKWYSSVYMYYNPVDKKLYMGPDWDFDVSCGNINYNGCDDYEGFWIKQSGWHNRLFKDPVFVERTKTRWNEIKFNLYNSINETLQSDATEVSESANYNFIRWNILGTYVWPNANGYEERTSYQSEVDYMVEWLNNRYLWMDSAINNL